MIDFPKRTRSLKYKKGILYCDDTKNTEIKIDVFTEEIMKQIGDISSLVGFYAEGYPFTDDLIAPLSNLKT